jgi:hypothetical protein
MLLGEMMSINDNPSLFLNSLFIAPLECAFQTYLAKNMYNISMSSRDGQSVIPFFSLSGSMLSLFLPSVYECGHVNALSDNTRNILYYLDVELTKILRLHVASQVAPHMCVFQTNRWNVNSVPFILKHQTSCSNSHIFVGKSVKKPSPNDFVTQWISLMTVSTHQPH